jgi:hypothetical protein
MVGMFILRVISLGCPCAKVLLAAKNIQAKNSIMEKDLMFVFILFLFN